MSGLGLLRHASDGLWVVGLARCSALPAKSEARPATHAPIPSPICTPSLPALPPSAGGPSAGRVGAPAAAAGAAAGICAAGCGTTSSTGEHHAVRPDAVPLAARGAGYSPGWPSQAASGGGCATAASPSNPPSPSFSPRSTAPPSTLPVPAPAGPAASHLPVAGGQPPDHAAGGAVSHGPGAAEPGQQRTGGGARGADRLQQVCGGHSAAMCLEAALAVLSWAAGG